MSVDIFQDRTVQIDDILNNIAESIQLDDTRRQRMKSAYEAVNKWIDGDEEFFNDYDFEVYVQGSVKIGTAIKPFSGDEFDLDTVLQVNISKSSLSPEQLYNELKRRLSVNKVYREKLELKNRCIRLNYEGDFHMDILPGCSSDWSLEEISIPDREKSMWLISNPKGYADWFLKKSKSREYILLERAYAYEDLPDEEPSSLKDPLKRAVQLVKWFRNEHFKDNLDQRIPSIILTTLYAKYYNGETSIFEALTLCTSLILDEIRNTSPNKIQVINPVNDEENFAEKWDQNPELYLSFVNFIQDFNDVLSSLESSNDRINESKVLKIAFGEEPVVSAYEMQSETINRKRKDRSLFIDSKTGSLGAATSSSSLGVKNNSFYGA